MSEAATFVAGESGSIGGILAAISAATGRPLGPSPISTVAKEV